MSQQTSICQSCHAGCCRSFAVPLMGSDVIRLEQSTGLDFWQFACRWEDREGMIAGDFAPHLFFDDEPETPFTLCLLHSSSSLFRETTKCGFLTEGAPTAESPLGTGRCGAYHHRPLACRVFPLSMQKSSQLTVLDDIPDYGRQGEASPAFQLCPRPWEQSDVDVIDGPQQVAVAKFESGFFKVVAALWNEQPGSWLRFPEFLRLVYSQRVVRATGQGLEADEPVIIPIHSNAQHRRAA